jgi:hypothetical protein
MKISSTLTSWEGRLVGHCYEPNYYWLRITPLHLTLMLRVAAREGTLYLRRRVPPLRAGYRRRLAERIQVVSISILSHRLVPTGTRMRRPLSGACGSERLDPWMLSSLYLLDCIRNNCQISCLSLKKTGPTNKIIDFISWNVGFWRIWSEHITRGEQVWIPIDLRYPKLRFGVSPLGHHPATRLCTKCCIRPAQVKVKLNK